MIENRLIFLGFSLLQFLNFHKSKREVKTASVMQVRKKMYQGSSEAWKDYEDYLKPLLKSLSSF